MDTKTDVTVKLTGTDGNVFLIIGKVSRELKRAQHGDLAREFEKAAFEQGSYDGVLQLVMSYVIVE